MFGMETDYNALIDFTEKTLTYRIVTKMLDKRELLAKKIIEDKYGLKGGIMHECEDDESLSQYLGIVKRLINYGRSDGLVITMNGNKLPIDGWREKYYVVARVSDEKKPNMVWYYHFLNDADIICV
ncbi:MAG: hypothetical protein V1870_00925 [Candidatus Aenigmatarchaeota archaeon]